MTATCMGMSKKAVIGWLVSLAKQDKCTKWTKLQPVGVREAKVKKQLMVSSVNITFDTSAVLERLRQDLDINEET